LHFFTVHIVFLYSTHGQKWCPSLDAERFGIEIVKEIKEMKSPKASQSLERNMQFGKKKG
jgi:hypothetical protein